MSLALLALPLLPALTAPPQELPADFVPEAPMPPKVELVGERVEVEFVRKIRDERAFPSKEALLAQIREDVASLGLS